MRIETATPSDLGAVKDAYSHARVVQEQQGSVTWPVFSDAAILSEVSAGRLYRVMDSGHLAGIFSVAYEDPAIWGDRERGEHIYLHRIARTASCRGKGLVDAIFVWASAHCAELGRVGLRMDTWAGNERLIAYYGTFGFRLVGNCHIGVDPRLAAHYHGNDFALLELEPLAPRA